jgi:hypothetical protein
VHGIKVAPSAYYAYLLRAPSKLALSDLVLTEVLAGYYEPQVDADGKKKLAPESLYGTTKMWAHLNRQGDPMVGDTIHHSDAGSQGGFKWSLQRLDRRELRWDGNRDGWRGRLGDRRCIRRGDRQWHVGSIMRCSGRRSVGAR